MHSCQLLRLRFFPSQIIAAIILVLPSCDYASSKKADSSEGGSNSAYSHSKNHRPRATQNISRDDPLGDFLPEGSTFVEICMPISRRLTHLIEKLDRTAQKDSKWNAEYRTKHKGIPPYHPRLGLTEVEYNEFQSLLSESQPEKAASTYVSFDWDDSDVVTLRPAPDFDAVHGVKIHTRRMFVETPHGTLRYEGWITPSDRATPTKPWNGHEWSNRYDDERERDVTFFLGQDVKTAQGVLRYHVGGTSPNRSRFALLYFDLPPIKKVDRKDDSERNGTESNEPNEYQPVKPPA